VQLTGRVQSYASSKGDFNLLIAQILLGEGQAPTNGKLNPKPDGEQTDATDDKTPWMRIPPRAGIIAWNVLAQTVSVRRVNFKTAIRPPR
jgi:hypothetical protein